MRAAAETYRDLLQQLDRWFAATAAAHPGVIPCTSGCTACCHGPFDISLADALLLREGLETLPAPVIASARARAERLLARMRTLAPDWGPPWDPTVLGEERFDDLAECLAKEPCPLLDEAGRCVAYEWRPLVCRMIGLPMMTAEGRVLENACPIQERFPAYAALDPQPFDLERLEELETACLEAAAIALGRAPGDREAETIIAGVVAGM